VTYAYISYILNLLVSFSRISWQAVRSHIDAVICRVWSSQNWPFVRWRYSAINIACVLCALRHPRSFSLARSMTVPPTVAALALNSTPGAVCVWRQNINFRLVAQRSSVHLSVRCIPFLPRDAMTERYMPWPRVYNVHLSDCHKPVSIKTAKHIIMQVMSYDSLRL